MNDFFSVNYPQFSYFLESFGFNLIELRRCFEEILIFESPRKNAGMRTNIWKKERGVRFKQGPLTTQVAVPRREVLAINAVRLQKRGCIKA